jgi:signal transduction histidine kinase
LEKTNDRINIRISDNGKGFDMNAKQEGNGLLNMCSRAKEIGVAIEIQSAPGKGTAIELHLTT